MSQQKKILIFGSVFFVLCAGFLFWQNQRELSKNTYWNIAFDHPERAESLDFVIENSTPDIDFDYVITSQNQVLEKNSVKIEKTRKVTIKPLTTARKNTLTLITVTHGNEKKEIYRK